MIYDTFHGPFGYPPYFAAQAEKRQIRRTANQVSWTVIFCGGLIFLLTQAAVFFLRAVGYSYNRRFSEFSGIPPALYYLLTCAVYALGIAAPALLYFALKRIPLQVGLPFRRNRAADTAALVFFGCMVCLLANYPAEWVSTLIERAGFNGVIPETPLSDDPLVLTFYGIETVVVPPLVEELMFRGVVLQSLRRFGDGFAVLASSLIFGMMHGNFPQTVFAFFAGLAMGFAAVQADSLLPSILIHFINNLVSFALQLINRYWGDAAVSTISEIVSAALLILGMLALVYLVRRRGFRYRQSRGGTVLALSGKMAALFSNPGTVIFTLLFLTLSVSVLQGG